MLPPGTGEAPGAAIFVAWIKSSMSPPRYGAWPKIIIGKKYWKKKSFMSCNFALLCRSAYFLILVILEIS